MADAAISTLLPLLGDKLIQHVKSLQGVEGKVELLKVELKAMQSFLKVANKKQYEDEMVRNWISQIREFAQDAEDTIEMFLLNVEKPSFLNKCTNFGKCILNKCCLLNKCFFLNTIGEDIELILQKLAVIKSSRETYGIKDLDEAAESAWRSEVESRRWLLPDKKGEDLVGIGDDVEKVLRESILDEENKGLSIAFLQGAGGIGKSTLAREIYNHPQVINGRFQCRVWVVVSSEFTLEATINDLISELVKSEEEKKKLQEYKGIANEQSRLQKLKQMLHDLLKDKSYFIVLDDVWEKEHLESLTNDFPNQEEKTSRILVTTRNKIITKYDQFVHKMKLLDFEKGWELFLKKAFIGSTSNGKCPEELESIGRQILKKCHGLPLAISVAGGLLVGTQTKSDWEQVLNQINFYMGRDESGVFDILELSYHNLSPQLKSCFLCLSFFKEDFTIPAKRLVNIWDAQGLIQQEGSISADEVGRGYLNELINRSMLQIQDLSYGERVKSCRIHDLVRDVCLRKAKEEINLDIVKGEEGTSTESSFKPRHRVVYGKNLQTSSSNQNKHLRSLFLLNDQDYWDPYVTTPSGYWKSYQLLKTLELDGCVFYKRLPYSFRLLIGLKCLRIHGSFGSRVLDLPSWLNHLKNLEVLDLPSWLNHLKNLEVLDMERVMVSCPRLLPLKMERLRYFACHIMRGPRQISSWKNMECLKHISHKDWMRYCTSNLTSGCRLRELGIRFIGDEKREELMKVKASLEKLQNLVILHLRWSGFVPMIELAIPNYLGSLTKLKLRGHMPTCPAASMFPPNLSHLTLKNSFVDDDLMAELGKLPKLSFLKLKDLYYIGETMHVLCDGFPCLEALTLQSQRNLKGIVIEEGGMPKLKHLRIRICPNLDTKNLSEHIIISTQ